MENRNEHRKHRKSVSLNISISHSSTKLWVMSTPTATLSCNWTADCEMLTDAHSSILMEKPFASTAGDCWLYESWVSESKRSDVRILFQEGSHTEDIVSLCKTCVCVKTCLLTGLTIQWRIQRELNGLNGYNSHTVSCKLQACVCVTRPRDQLRTCYNISSSGKARHFCTLWRGELSVPPGVCLGGKMLKRYS